MPQVMPTLNIVTFNIRYITRTRNQTLGLPLSFFQVL